MFSIGPSSSTWAGPNLTRLQVEMLTSPPAVGFAVHVTVFMVIVFDSLFNKMCTAGGSGAVCVWKGGRGAFFPSRLPEFPQGCSEVLLVYCWPG